MSDEEPTNAELVQTAREIAGKTREILEGRIEPYDPELHKWATSKLSLLGRARGASKNLVEAAENCLVNILSCDNAPWDTPIPAFREGLARLNQEVTADC